MIRARFRQVATLILTLAAILAASGNLRASGKATKRPNILFAISDDQSFPHCSAYGCTFVKTPAFDRIAKEGVLFRNAYAASCGCSPSRAALLTGRHTWQLKQAGTHASSFPREFVVFPDLLQRAGYFIGYTGKPWGPGNWKISGRTRNPAGPAFNRRKAKPPAKGIRNTDYAGNFQDFLTKRPKGKPFCFWYGASEPHRAFANGIGLKSGKKLKDVQVPPFLPDTKTIRCDLLDYAYEIEWFDRHLARMIQALEKTGELENTIIVVTSDNGMAFPRAKANLYEFGTHVPLAISWGNRIRAGRLVDDMVGFVDLAPTFLQAAGLKPPVKMTGKSLMNVLLSKKQGQVDPKRMRVFTARERHSSSRVKNLGYPCRAMRRGDYLYIRNFASERWPAGDPRGVGGAKFGYYDIDGAPAKTFLIENKDKYGKLFALAVAKRPADELYNVKKDPGCLVNLARKAKWKKKLDALRTELTSYLLKSGDPRLKGNGSVFESYRRYSRIRKFQ